jgi:Arc/MetJ-type ribon-helix-helix transcriptional regulator
VLKSKRITVTVPGEFVELIEERKREEHFSSDSKYFQSLLLFDLLTRAPHAITGQVVNDPEWLQNKVYAEIVREFPNARKDWSPWLKHRIEELRKQGENSAVRDEKKV